MSLTNLTTKTPYAGNGVTTVFPFTFKVFDPTHLVVTETVTATGVTTTLVLNTDYTVTGVGLDAGGSITRASAPPTGTTGLIRRVMPLTQTADIRNQSAFYAATHEDVFDKAAMVDQYLQDQITDINSEVGAGPVLSFNGRTGIVVPAANDYSFAQISGTAAVGQIPNLPASDITATAGTNAIFGSSVDVVQRGLDALVQSKVKSATTAAQPGSPSDGDTYLLPTGSTGAAWAGNGGKIARYSSVTSAWEFYTPQNGWETYAQDTGIYWFRVAGAWTAQLTVGNGTASTSPTTGDLVAKGGAGIGGAVYANGGFNSTVTLSVAGNANSFGATTTATSGTSNNAYFPMTVNPASNATGANYACRALASVNGGANTIGTTDAFQGSVTYTGSGTLSAAFCFEAAGINVSGGGTITNAYGFRAYLPNVSSGTISNNYGVYINDQKPAGVTNGYGLYITAQGAGGYAIYTNAGTVRFGDNVITTGSYTGAGTGLTGTASSLTAGTATVANGLNSATTTVSVSGATAPTSGQVLTATSSTTAVWQTPSGGGVGAFNRIVNGSFYQGLAGWGTSGTTAPIWNSNSASANSGSASGVANVPGATSLTTTGSIYQGFSVPTPSGALTLNFKTAIYYTANPGTASTGYVKVYLYNLTAATETLIGTYNLTGTGTSASFTSQSITVTSNITAAGDYGLRFEIQAVMDNTGGIATSRSTIVLVDEVNLVI